MKSQITVLILSVLFLLSSPTAAQPKLSVDFGLGLYEPTLSGFDENTDVPFPTANIFNRNLLLDWGVYYEFFSNARVGYTSMSSYEIGDIELVNATSVFYRTIRYRFFPIQTFFRWKQKIELNFTLAPIWGIAKISVDTSPGDKSDDWNQILNSFGDESPMTKMTSTDAMRKNWIGYSGLIGVRYYLSSRLGIDVKAGFMNNGYKQDKWRLSGEKVKGPAMTIDDLPVFSFKLVYGIK